jgi:uncharacterized protein
MKWTYSWLNQPGHGKFTFDEQIIFDSSLIKTKSATLLELKPVHVKGNGVFSSSTNTLTLDLNIEGVMIVPCALSLEPTSYPFKIETEEKFGFDLDEEKEDYWPVFNDTVDLYSLVWQLICLEIPLKVIKEGAKIKTSGDGWKLVSEDEQEMEQASKIDPRLAKLKDYFKQEN